MHDSSSSTSSSLESETNLKAFLIQYLTISSLVFLSFLNLLRRASKIIDKTSEFWYSYFPNNLSSLSLLESFSVSNLTISLRVINFYFTSLKYYFSKLRGKFNSNNPCSFVSFSICSDFWSIIADCSDSESSFYRTLGTSKIS